jgi:hypothetical protein
VRALLGHRGRHNKKLVEDWTTDVDDTMNHLFKRRRRVVEVERVLVTCLVMLQQG